MSVVELQELEEVKGLVAKGQQVGVLTYAEIATAVSELDLDEGDVEELHGYFEKSEIELVEEIDPANVADRKSTCLNSSHPSISYAVFCLKKKKKKQNNTKYHTK